MDETRDKKWESLTRIYTEVMARLRMRTVIVCIPDNGGYALIASNCQLDLAISALQQGLDLTNEPIDKRAN